MRSADRVLMAPGVSSTAASASNRRLTTRCTDSLSSIEDFTANHKKKKMNFKPSKISLFDSQESRGVEVKINVNFHVTVSMIFTNNETRSNYVHSCTILNWMASLFCRVKNNLMIRRFKALISFPLLPFLRAIKQGETPPSKSESDVLRHFLESQTMKYPRSKLSTYFIFPILKEIK